jgi:hypothetical protein
MVDLVVRIFPGARPVYREAMPVTPTKGGGVRVLMLLENQWFKDPPRMRRMLETTYKGNRSEFIRTFLFFGCTTGRRIQAAFGDRWTDPGKAIWEETSPEMGSRPGEKFPADLGHLSAVMQSHNPDAVVLFGKTAQDAFDALTASVFGAALRSPRIIRAPHPAARSADVPAQLKAAADQLNEIASQHLARANAAT